MLAETTGAAAAGGGVIGGSVLLAVAEFVRYVRAKRNGHCNGGANRLCMQHAERLAALETEIRGLRKHVDDGVQRIEKGIDMLWQELKRRNGSG